MMFKLKSKIANVQILEVLITNE